MTTYGEAESWKVSLHGGHSGEFCDHAEGTLREMLAAAVRFGYHTFGVSEHAPRHGRRFLYPEEKNRGWTLDKIVNDFELYLQSVTPLALEFSDRLAVLRGFECEVVPTDRYVDIMRQYRERRLPDGTPAFDYCVGSVHYVDELQLDGPPDTFVETVHAFGGLEALAVRYYETVAEMVERLQPEVVGHLDLIKRNIGPTSMDQIEITTDRVTRAAHEALVAVRRCGAILDLNTAGWRKELGEPYPAPWLVQMADEMGVGFCFGDDSHRPAEVGSGVADARTYLIENGVQNVTVLTREGDIEAGKVARQVVSLQPQQ